MAADGKSPAGADDDDAGDWGPFGKPLFDDPSARALSRVGVVDVGSNSVRMVVFDGAARSPAYFYNEKIMCGLGKGLAETGIAEPRRQGPCLGGAEAVFPVGQGDGGHIPFHSCRHSRDAGSH
jgi:exopolyphosphatase/guanosine-5'-triphosphate,3'-diphosphate pyrophosphatase